MFSFDENILYHICHVISFSSLTNGKKKKNMSDIICQQNWYVTLDHKTSHKVQFFYWHL